MNATKDLKQKYFKILKYCDKLHAEYINLYDDSSLSDRELTAIYTKLMKNYAKCKDANIKLIEAYELVCKNNEMYCV